MVHLTSSILIGAMAAARPPASRTRSPLSRLRAAYRRGGTAEVVRRGRIRLARAVYPDDFPVVAPRKKKAKKAAVVPLATMPSAPALNAVDVTHEQAMAFFERRRPTYERLVARVAPHIGEDDLVLDVGGNIGYFSLVLGEVTGLKGIVHLYEPVPHLAELCSVTLADAPYQVVVHPYGLAENDLTTHIFVAADGNLGWNTLVAGRTQQNMTKVPIELRAFDPASIEKPPSFIKIDVEGAEHRVLEGLWGALESWSPRPVILCEIGWGSGHPDWEQELAVLLRLVNELGYRPEGMDGGEVDLEAISRTTDVLFLPRESDHDANRARD